MMERSRHFGLLKFDAARTALVLGDVCAVAFSLWLATALYFDFEIPQAFALQEAVHGMLLVASVLACFSYAHLYSRKVPTAGRRDLRRLLAATVAAFVVFFAVANFVPDAHWTPFFLFLVALFLGWAVIGILASYGAISWGWFSFAAPVLAGLLLAAGWKLAGEPYRIALDARLPVSRTISLSAFLLSAALFLALRGALSLAWGLWHRERRGLRKVYLFGEFDEAAKFLRSDSAQNLEILGLFVESPAQWGVQLNGIRILGGEEALKKACAEKRPDAVVLALRKNHASHGLLEFLRGRGVRCFEVDPWGALLGSRVPNADEIAMESLMERREYRFVPDDSENYLRGKVVLVTGAGGSIGSELCRQVALCRPEKVILLGHGENSIVRLYRRFPPEARAFLVPAICSVNDREALRRVFAEHRPQIVFHAAAHKHVDLMELNPAEAVRNNVGGAESVLACVEEFDAERFLFVSTDKAVDPVNVMGRTKLMGELLTAEARERNPKCDYRAVRFGNVLGSRGSVVPLFLDQIRLGGPVTITDPRMKRYFMSIPEAVSLILEAGCVEDPSGVFVLAMGEPVSIQAMAEGLIRQCGLRPGIDVKIECTGIRPGERLDESLVAAGETMSETGREKIRRVVSSRPLAERIAEARAALAPWAKP